MTARVRVVVTGRVQGVFFRVRCADEARRLGVGGWVRNTGDGAVEAAFEGEDAAVDEMVAWCRSGPELARVDDVTVHPEPTAGEPSFRIV